MLALPWVERLHVVFTLHAEITRIACGDEMAVHNQKGARQGAAPALG